MPRRLRHRRLEVTDAPPPFKISQKNGYPIEDLVRVPLFAIRVSSRRFAVILEATTVTGQTHVSHHNVSTYGLSVSDRQAPWNFRKFVMARQDTTGVVPARSVGALMSGKGQKKSRRSRHESELHGLDVRTRPRVSEACVLGIRLVGLLCTVAVTDVMRVVSLCCNCTMSRDLFLSWVKQSSAKVALLSRPAVGYRPRDGDERCSRG